MIKVCKFGGSSVASAEQFKKVKDIIDSDKDRKFIVTSALGRENSDDYKVTDLLYIANAHIKFHVSADDIFSIIEKKYKSVRDALNVNVDIESEFEKIKSYVKKDNDVDYLVSRGEYLAALLLSKYLKADFVDACDVIKFDYKSNIDLKATKEAFDGIVNVKNKVVFPGFYGAMPDGKIKVMSRGGSDITGSIIANIVDADIYENWTDVSGIKVIDPRIVENPNSIKYITYNELREMSYMGANVLHDEAVFPVKNKQIPINIRNTNDKDHPGTIIMSSCEDVDKVYTPSPITGITGKKNFSVITCIKSHISGEVGFLRKVLTIFEEHDISIESCPSSVDSVSIVVETSKIKNNLYEIILELKEKLMCEDVHVTDGIALIAIVGRAMANKHGMSGQIFEELGKNGINIKIISQGSDEICIVVGIDNADFEKAIKCIYIAFSC